MAKLGRSHYRDNFKMYRNLVLSLFIYEIVAETLVGSIDVCSCFVTGSVFAVFVNNRLATVVCITTRILKAALPGGHADILYVVNYGFLLRIKIPF